jgi:hypothetical protein
LLTLFAWASDDPQVRTKILSGSFPIILHYISVLPSEMHQFPWWNPHVMLLNSTILVDK